MTLTKITLWTKIFSLFWNISNFDRTCKAFEIISDNETLVDKKTHPISNQLEFEVEWRVISDLGTLKARLS
jgi:hypothetical protein